MYIIGERINGMFKRVRAAIEEQNKSVIQELVRAQLEGAANALDVNVGPAQVDPLEAMHWLIDTIREVSDVTLCIDNPKYEIQKEVIPRLGPRAIINSSKADEEALEKFVALAAENDARLIALTIDKKGVPADVERRVELGAFIVVKAMEGGLPMDHLYIDPIILPVNVAPKQPQFVLEALRQLRILSDTPPHLNLGLSNLSQGCANRPLINRSYLVMAVLAGLDAAIMDPLDKDLVDAMITAELLTEKMIYCDSYLEAYRMTNCVGVQDRMGCMRR